MDEITQKNYEAIKTSPLGNVLSDEQCKVLSEVVSLRCLQDDDVLVDEGTADDSLHVITKGRFAVTHETGGGDKVTLHIHEAGRFAGEMGFVDGMKHTASLRSLGHSEVFTLKRDDFETLIDSHPRLVYQIMQLVVRSVHNTMYRMNNQYIQLSNYISKTHGRY